MRGTILVHSSLSALGWVCGRAEAVVLALLDVLGDDGTPVVPSQSADDSDPAECIVFGNGVPWLGWRNRARVFCVGPRSLGFYLNRPSKTTGQLASFETHPNNDIRLPTSPDPSLWNQHQDGRSNRRNFQNYHNFHFFFYLSTSGEPILRDLSPCLTSIEVTSTSPGVGALYELHGLHPRQRVIPRTTQEVYITFGKRTSFTLFWNPSAIEDNKPSVQENLAQHARLLAVPGVPFSAPDEKTAEQPNPSMPRQSQRELRSRYAPSVATVASNQQIMSKPRK